MTPFSYWDSSNINNMKPEPEYENLGYQNGWDREKEGGVPYEYLRCIDAGHQRREENIGKCQTQVFCSICWITYKYDSGD